MDALKRTERKQKRVEEKIRSYSWGETVEEHNMFIETIHQFFSPQIIPEGLTETEARMIYLLARSLKLTKPYFSKEFVSHNGKVTRSSFQNGLTKFRERVLLGDGKIKDDGSVLLWID
jgi:hypothetical protein